MLLNDESIMKFLHCLCQGYARTLLERVRAPIGLPIVAAMLSIILVSTVCTSKEHMHQRELYGSTLAVAACRTRSTP